MVLRKSVLVLVGTLVIGISLSLAPAIAQEAVDEAAFVFAGRFYSEHLEDQLNPLGPFGVDYEDNFLIGGGYQRFYLGPDWLRFGWEAGATVGFGEDVRGEAWAGLVGRFDAISIGQVHISASLTAGMSAITNTIGIETERVAPGANPHLLFYVAPEIGLSLDSQPNLEAFMRVQHRSGGWGLIGSMGDGHNATSVGMRWRF
ncbi:hypothetical protein GCM10010862_02510 [Devosia nitrariae]|uniref:Outer membrane protein beta-barrel domain-containing protein n=1 Tax=Devosia nitrariae TaxID=2071872 RepID=A0ABQ5VYY3_9HYPH|nr:hypothetical protein GCM10010862_02510 [Devosia nitrariae]